ncbi:hypothetical protein C3B59_10480 [Cryobacterium zongtaii]|uniref:Uncharacterized protein n=1 Tax=Cryobacterium zongtaii TaxID=1259217 RepID=A0A2S3ZCK6_9MICO|nr:phage tail domain-containing protein [Cryobacterium zongtaii]POH63961.1 hypothetical protein C3B59_10480 [Cryobacterium zongtaii]
MRLFLESAIDRIELGGTQQSAYMHGPRTSGLGVSEKLPRFARGTGAGTSYQGMRTGSRTADLNVIVCGTSRAATEEAFRRLVSIMLPRKGRPLPKLVAEYPTGEALELPFVYRSGLEVDRTASLPVAADFLVSIECPAPYWTAREALQFVVSNGAGAVGLLPHLAELPVGSSTAVGSITVENPGDVESDIAWTITGPGGPIPISVDGVGFVFETPLVTGEVVTIRRTALGIEVLDQSGANRYTDLGYAPKFPRLPEGTSRVDISMQDASPGTWVATADVVATNRVTSPALRTNSTGWSTYATDATQSRVPTGFFDTDAGFMQLTWSAEAPADAAVQVEVAVSAGERLSGGLSVLSSVAQVFYPACIFVGADGAPVGPLLVGRTVEAPAATVVQLFLTEQDVGAAPEGATALRIMASVDSTTGQPWPAGAVLKTSLGIVSDAPIGYFDGGSEFAGWVGAADASASTLFRTIVVGQSSVTGYYKPRREVVY